MTFEQQIAAIMDGATINTVQLTATRQADGTVGFYTALHADDVKCVFSEYMDKPTAHEAIASGIDALNRKRAADAVVAPLAPMAEAA